MLLNDTNSVLFISSDISDKYEEGEDRDKPTKERIYQERY